MPRAKTRDIPIDEMLYVISYEPKTGVLERNGKALNAVMSKGYKCLYFKGRSYLAHRVAWALHYEEQPPDQIDHINGDKFDNSIENLRAATTSQNCAAKKQMDPRNKSGVRGVSWNREVRKWRAAIKLDGKTIFLGYYEKKSAAADAYDGAAALFFGEFAGTR